MKHLNLIFSLALGTLLMSCDSDAFTYRQCHRNKGQQYYIRIYAPTVSKPSNGMFTSNPYRYFSEYNQSEGTNQYYFHMNWGWGPGTSSWNIAGDYTTGNLDFGNKNALFYIK